MSQACKYFFKKIRQTLHEITTPETKWAEGVFQTQSPIFGVNFSNIITITHVRVNEMKN